IPVYLGDALQWNARELMGVNELEILVPPATEGDPPSVLRFPEEAVIEPSAFDELLRTMLTYAETKAVQFTGAWTFPSEVQPLFPVPSCVLFAKGAKMPAKLPKMVTRFAGHLPRR